MGDTPDDSKLPAERLAILRETLTPVSSERIDELTEEARLAAGLTLLIARLEPRTTAELTELVRQQVIDKFA